MQFRIAALPGSDNKLCGLSREFFRRFRKGAQIYRAQPEEANLNGLC